MTSGAPIESGSAPEAPTTVALADTPVELSAKERMFLVHYGRTWGVATAGRRAGMAQGAWQEMITRPHVKAAMERLLKATLLSAGQVEGNIVNLSAPVGDELVDVDESGFPRLNFSKVKALGLMDNIHSVEYDAEGRPKVKFYDRLKALELLAKVKGMFNDGMNISLNTDINIGGVRSTIQAALKAPQTLDEMMNLAEKLAAESGPVLDVKALPQSV